VLRRPLDSTQCIDHAADRVDVVANHPGEEGVVVGEAPDQRLGQVRDLLSQPAQRQIGEHLEVVPDLVEVEVAVRHLEPAWW
jgi:hypothetical protein